MIPQDARLSIFRYNCKTYRRKIPGSTVSPVFFSLNSSDQAQEFAEAALNINPVLYICCRRKDGGIILKRWLVFGLKAIFKTLGLIMALPLACVFILMGYLAILVNRYSDVSALVSKVPLFWGEYTRYLYYKATLQHLGKKAIFKYGSFCQYHTTRIGDRAFIGFYAILGEVTIGDDAMIGGYVNITSGLGQHSFADPAKPMNQQPGKRQRVHIGSDVWIGNSSIIASDIGDRCVIGAGSVLVKPAEDHSVYVGNPAKLLKKIE